MDNKNEQENVVKLNLKSDVTAFNGAFGEATGDVQPAQVVVAAESIEKAPDAPLSTELPIAVVNDKQPVAQVPEVPSNAPVDLQVELEKERQKARTAAGRLAAVERDKAILAAEIQALKVKKPEAPVAQPVNVTESIVDTDDPQVEAFIKEMGPEFIAPLDKYIAKRIQAAIEPFKALPERVPAIEQHVVADQQERAKTHYDAILVAHADVADLLAVKPETGKSKIDEYVESLPYSEAIKCQEIIKHGKTAEVIKFLDDFKAKSGQVTSVETPRVVDLSKDKVAAATVVKTHVVSVPKGEVDKNDYLGAWSQATAQ